MVYQNKNFSIKTVEDTESFFQLREEWTRLLKRSITNSFFLSWEWLYSWWQTGRIKKASNDISGLYVKDLIKAKELIDSLKGKGG